MAIWGRSPAGRPEGEEKSLSASSDAPLYIQMNNDMEANQSDHYVMSIHFSKIEDSGEVAVGELISC